MPVRAPRNSLTRRCIHESGSAERTGEGKKKKAKGRREERVIVRSVHYLSGGEEEEEERLACRIPTDRKKGVEKNI